jgi:hypothetical protein
MSTPSFDVYEEVEDTSGAKQFLTAMHKHVGLSMVNRSFMGRIVRMIDCNQLQVGLTLEPSVHMGSSCSLAKLTAPSSVLKVFFPAQLPTGAKEDLEWQETTRLEANHLDLYGVSDAELNSDIIDMFNNILKVQPSWLNLYYRAMYTRREFRGLSLDEMSIVVRLMYSYKFDAAEAFFRRICDCTSLHDDV